MLKGNISKCKEKIKKILAKKKSACKIINVPYERQCTLKAEKIENKDCLTNKNFNCKMKITQSR